jgi:hypothetical protein
MRIPGQARDALRVWKDGSSECFETRGHEAALLNIKQKRWRMRRL